LVIGDTQPPVYSVSVIADRYDQTAATSKDVNS